MQALILVGGEGTRLRPLTLTHPKPAITLVDRPFIRYMVDWVSRHGVTEVIMACGFRADDLRSALGERIPGGSAIRYLEEPEPLGTAGPVRLAADMGLLEGRFLVLNGDVLMDLDLTALLHFHEAHEAVATIALHPVEDPTSYGLVRTADDGAIREFLEKPDPAEIDTDQVNAGAYVLEQSMIDLIPPGRAVSIEREVFPRLVGQGLYGHRLEGYWMDIGTPERYLQASWDILEGRLDTEIGARLAGGVLIEAGADVDADASIEPPALVQAGASVAVGARVGPRAIVADGTEVEGGAVIEGSVVLAGCRIGRDACVRDAILGPGVEVGEGALIDDGSVVGERAQIAAWAEIEGDSRVAPGEVVAA